MEFASRLGPLTSAQIQAALTRFGLGEFIAASPVPFGHSGQNIFVDSTAGSFVLRGNPLFPGQFNKERFFARLLHERSGVPVPWPYHVDPGTEIFGWSYALMPRLSGISPIDRSVEGTLTAADRRAMIVALAQALVALHSVSWPHSGQYAPETDTIEPLPVPFAAWIEEQVWAKAQRAESGGEALSDTDLAWLRSLLGEANNALTQPFVPGFAMHDYWLPNVLFDRCDGTWQVCGVFDFAEAYSGDGEADLARPMSVLLRRDEALASVFLHEYLALRPPRPGILPRFAVYLVDELLLGWAYHRSRGLLQGNRSLQELVEPYTSAIARFL